jgi:hypothetical protein
MEPGGVLVMCPAHRPNDFKFCLGIFAEVLVRHQPYPSLHRVVKKKTIAYESATNQTQHRSILPDI